MKLTEITEGKMQKGTYAGVHFSKKTQKSLEQYCKANEIPNSVPREKFHTTLLYSRKHLPDYKAQGTFETPLIGKPMKFEIWKSQEGNNCLVLTFKCKALEDRHHELMDLHKATYDFPTYKTHVTLSYDVGDFDLNKLDVNGIGDLEIAEEYQENLNLNWAKDNTAKDE